MSAIAPIFPLGVVPLSQAPVETPVLHELHEAPALLEYRGDADPDLDFIPKTVAGFAFGALAMGVMLDLGETLWVQSHQDFAEVMQGMVTRFAFMLGIMGVSASLLLVGLKVRADHSAVLLFAKHWLNSIGTGSAYAFMMYVPWVLINHDIVVNRFLAAAVLMVIMIFPAIAAKWTIGPHIERHPAV